jgi:hypothetical protein
MDPLSALGVAAAVIQFIDFSMKTCKKIHGIIQHGSPSMLQEGIFRATAIDFSAFHRDFGRRKKFSSGLPVTSDLKENEEASLRYQGL